jgi:adenylate cyclase
LIGERTFILAQGQMEARQIDTVRVVSRREPVPVFELFGPRGSATDPVRERHAGYAGAAALYRQRRWAESIAALRTLCARFPEDGPAAALLRRCEHFLVMPPPPDWDGVYDLKQK